MAINKDTASLNRTTYTCYPTDGTGTINNGTTLNCSKGSLSFVTNLLITNFNTSGNLIARLNASTNDSIIVGAGKTLVLNDEKISRVYLVNSSGSAITYQVVFLGG